MIWPKEIHAISVRRIGLVVILLTIPLIQLGCSYYYSFQLMGFLVLVGLVLLGAIRKRFAVLLCVASMIFFVKISDIIVNDDGLHDLAWVAREWLVCLVIFGAAGLSINPKDSRLVSKAASVFLIISLPLVIVQYIGIKLGVFISFDRGWFVTNTNTLDGVQAALEAGTRLRPVGFYAEPSYMSFVVLSSLVILLSSREVLSGFVWFVVSAIIVLFLGSLSGVAAVFFVYLASIVEWSKVDRQIMRRVVLVLVVTLPLIVAMGYFSQAGVYDRILSLFSKGITKENLSAYIRLVVPVHLVGDVFSNRFFLGYDSGEISRFLSSSVAVSVDNAALFIIAHYGFLGSVLVALLFFLRRSFLYFTYISMVMFFNGSLLSYDKALVVSLVLFSSFWFYRPRAIESTGVRFT